MASQHGSNFVAICLRPASAANFNPIVRQVLKGVDVRSLNFCFAFYLVLLRVDAVNEQGSCFFGFRASFLERDVRVRANREGAFLLCDWVGVLDDKSFPTSGMNQQVKPCAVAVKNLLGFVGWANLFNCVVCKHGSVVMSYHLAWHVPTRTQKFSVG
jgi:hypothetical protein